jgi:hypothetical protein
MFSGNTMMDFTFLSENEAWAVGSSGFTSRWNGEEWEGIQSPTNKSLHAVAFTSPNDGWAVGYENTILHWDGTNWSHYPPPEININPKPKNIMFDDIKFSNSNDGWISGAWESNNDMRGVILHWDGLSWQYTEEKTNFINSSNCLCSIEIISQQDVWIVGSTFGDSEMPIAPIIHWNGTNWSDIQNVVEVDGSLHIVKAISKDDIWFGGEENIKYSNKFSQWYSRGYLLHWNGLQWNKIELPERWNDETIISRFTRIPKSQVLLTLFVTSSKNIIVGGNVQAQWNGKVWSDIKVPRKDLLIFDIELNPNGRLFAVASNGLFLGLFG